MTIEELKGELLPGKKLFQSTSEFYSWYMSWINTPSSQAKVFQTLSELMRIALLSSEGGKYLSFGEEEKVLAKLTGLKEQLCDGTIKNDSTLGEIRRLVDNIIAHNPKAKMVSYATEIEYHFCILKPQTTQTVKLQNYLKDLLKHVTPSLLEIQAYAISQVMGRILENPLQHADPEPLLQKEISQWIRSV